MSTRKAWAMLVVAVSLIVLPACSPDILAALNPPTVAGAETASTEAGSPVTQDPPPITADTVVALERALNTIYEDVSPSVVYIEVVKTATAISQQIPEGPFGMPSPLPGDPYQRGSGSGFVWDTDGHIVTNDHVVSGAEQIRVTFTDGTMVEATLVGADPDSDLAVIQVDRTAADLQPVRLADSTQVKVGDLAIAIGNPFGLESTMTVGFISALGRSLPAGSELAGATYSIPDIIQTDAAINPGNSGGVLVDDQGAVIGVTTAIASSTRASAGVGFVVPSAIVAEVVPVLIEEGSYAHAWLGISGATLTPDLAEVMDLPADQDGVLVATVVPEGPADDAGVQGSNQEVTIDGVAMQVGGDVIIAIDDQPVDQFEDIVSYLAFSTIPGQEITLTVLRDGEELTLDVTLGERPANTQLPTVQTMPEPEADEDEEPGEEEAAEGDTSGRAWLGVTGMTLAPELTDALDLPADQQGVLLVEVAPGSPAAAADLRGSDGLTIFEGQPVPIGGDIITAFDGEAVTSFEELTAAVSAAEPGQEVILTVLRDGERLDVPVTLATRD